MAAISKGVKKAAVYDGGRRTYQGKHALNLKQTKLMQTLHTCDNSGVVLSTGNMLDAAVPKVLKWFRHIDLE